MRMVMKAKMKMEGMKGMMIDSVTDEGPVAIDVMRIFVKVQ